MTIDDELAAAGVRWRAGLDADPSLEELFATSRQRRPIGPMLAAAAVIIALAIAAVLVGTRHDATPAAGGPTAPVHPAQCVDDFSVTLTPTPVDVPDGVASTAEIRLRYTGRATCSTNLDITSVDLLRQGAPAVTVYTRGQIGFVSPPAPIEPGTEFDATLTWSSYCDTAPVTAFRLHLGDTDRGVDVASGKLATPACARNNSTPLLVTFLMPTSDAATLRIGIREVGGPPPGNNPDLYGGTVVVSLGTDPYRTAVVTAGERTTVVVAASGGSYRVTATSGDAQCLPQSITPAAGTVTDLTVQCSVK